MLCIIDGKTGILIWEFTKSNAQYLLDLYSAQYIYDQTEDGYSDVLISHTSDQSSIESSLNILLSYWLKIYSVIMRLSSALFHIYAYFYKWSV